MTSERAEVLRIALADAHTIHERERIIDKFIGNDEAQRLREEHRALREALKKACDVAIWMSGSADFSPDGIARKGWLQHRPRLYEAMATLDRLEAKR